MRRDINTVHSDTGLLLHSRRTPLCCLFVQPTSLTRTALPSSFIPSNSLIALLADSSSAYSTSLRCTVQTHTTHIYVCTCTNPSATATTTTTTTGQHPTKTSHLLQPPETSTQEQRLPQLTTKSRAKDSGTNTKCKIAFHIICA